MKKLLPLLLALLIPACHYLSDAETVGYVIKEGNTGIFDVGYIHMKSDQASSIPEVLVVEDDALKTKLHDAMLTCSPVKVHYEIELMLAQPSMKLIDSVEIMEEIK